MLENKLVVLKDMTLLLVEDDTFLLDNIHTTLSLFFKHILVASNGEEALEIYEKNPVDVIITDYVMPKLSGHEFCLEVRKNNNKIPLVIMSNYSDKDKLLNSIPLNLTKYLIKPISYQELVSTLLDVIDKLEEENLLSFRINEEIVYDKTQKQILKKDESYKLTKNEIKLLEYLLESSNSIVPIENIEHILSAKEIKSDQAIKNIIHRLRQKIGKDAISNIQGVGYMIHTK